MSSAPLTPVSLTLIFSITLLIILISANYVLTGCQLCAEYSAHMPCSSQNNSTAIPISQKEAEEVSARSLGTFYRYLICTISFFNWRIITLQNFIVFVKPHHESAIDIQILVQEGGDICIPMADSCWGLIENNKICKVIILQLKNK